MSPVSDRRPGLASSPQKGENSGVERLVRRTPARVVFRAPGQRRPASAWERDDREREACALDRLEATEPPAAVEGVDVSLARSLLLSQLQAASWPVICAARISVRARPSSIGACQDEGRESRAGS